MAAQKYAVAAPRKLNYSVGILAMVYLLKHYLVEETMFSGMKMGPNTF